MRISTQNLCISSPQYGHISKFDKNLFFFLIFEKNGLDIRNNVLGHQKKKVFFQKKTIGFTMKIYWKWHNFFQIFIFFCRKINFFGPKIFSQICTPRPTLVPKIKLLYWKLPISAGPTYFGVTDLAPLWVGPVSKKLQIVRKLFIGIYRKFQVDMPKDKKVIRKKV